MRVLIVTQAFADYAKGERITDPELVDVLFRSHRGHVVPVNQPDLAPSVEEPEAAEPEAGPDPESDLKPAVEAEDPAPAHKPRAKKS